MDRNNQSLLLGLLGSLLGSLLSLCLGSGLLSLLGHGGSSGGGSSSGGGGLLDSVGLLGTSLLGGGGGSLGGRFLGCDFASCYKSNQESVRRNDIPSRQPSPLVPPVTRLARRSRTTSHIWRIRERHAVCEDALERLWGGEEFRKSGKGLEFVIQQLVTYPLCE